MQVLGRSIFVALQGSLGSLLFLGYLVVVHHLRYLIVAFCDEIEAIDPRYSFFEHFLTSLEVDLFHVHNDFLDHV